MKNIYVFYILLFVLFFPFLLTAEERFVNIEWEKDAKSDKYLVQIAEDEDFYAIVYEVKVSENSLKVPLSDTIHENFFTRIAGIGKNDVQGNFSAPVQIKVLIASKVHRPKHLSEQTLDTPIDDEEAFVSNLVSFSLNTNDKDSGISHTIYNVNDGIWQIYNGKFDVSHEGSNLIQYYSVDKLGNKEQLKKIDFYLDTISPIISIKPIAFGSRGGMQFSGNQSSIHISALDEGSGLKSLTYSIQALGKKENSYVHVTKHELKIPMEFVNQDLILTVIARDTVGNQSEKQFVFYYDGIPPKIETDLVPSKVYYKRGAKISLSASDDKSGVNWIQYSLNGSKAEFYTDSIELTKEGNQNLKIIAEDGAGNVSVKEITSIYVIEKNSFDTKIRAETTK